MRGLCTLLAAALALALPNAARAKMMTKAQLAARQAAAAEQFHQRTVRAPAVDAKKGASGSGVKNITFTNPKASQFYVDGTTIPEVDWDVGPSWSGLLPISNKTGETRELFFWFFPPGPEGSLDDLVFWTNGGPGCSSLEGLLQENGPFSWPWGQAKPTQNQYSWTNISSMLYVEQPVGTGFSQGTPNIVDEEGLAEQLVGFMQQFLSVFSELKGKKLYLTGESYAGMYVPYIADYIYAHPTLLDLQLQGIWIADPLISWGVVQEQIPAVDFVLAYQNVFSLPNATLTSLIATAQKCGYTGYMDQHVTYPPKGLLPLPGKSTEAVKGCDVWGTIFDAALEVNPAFNEYRIFDVYPILWDVLGFPGSFPQVQAPIYFDRTDVKKAIHAPTNVTWNECSNDNVFAAGPGGNDASLPSSLTVLPGVIEKSKRTVIMHGLADFILLSGGTRIAIQNMTWAGKQGFQSAPVFQSFKVDGMKAPMGNVHAERGLAYYEVVLSGHMIPQFSPWSAFQGMQYLTGQRDTP